MYNLNKASNVKIAKKIIFRIFINNLILSGSPRY